MMRERLEALRERIAVAARGAGRDPGEVELLPVSKGHDAQAVREAIGLGLTRFGESYISEAIPKIEEIERLQPAEWVYLGPIQSNKTRPIAERFSWVLALSSVKVAQRLSAQRPADLPDLNVCIQVNVDDDPAKAGLHPDELGDFLDAVTGLPRLRPRGLMTIPRQAPAGTPTPAFAELARLLEAHRRPGLDWDVLSMGMSGDFEQAIAHGATQVRLGTALFGERPAKPGAAPAPTSGPGPA